MHGNGIVGCALFYKPIWQLTVNERGHYADSEDTFLFKIEYSPDTRRVWELKVSKNRINYTSLFSCTHHVIKSDGSRDYESYLQPNEGLLFPIRIKGTISIMSALCRGNYRYTGHTRTPEAAIEGVQASVDALKLVLGGWCLKIEIVFGNI